MAGAGKTSLAMHLFKESSVIGHFDRKAWCTVSQSYQTYDQEELADKLCRCLKKRRYLVVIADVWHIALWNYLSRYFPNDKTQSRILITTKDYNVASETKSKIHELRALTEDESWELLQNKLPRHQSLPINLVRIAKEVAKTCRGLPLSIVVIGGLMFNAERTEEMWNQIVKDVTSTILTDPQGKCKDILELSYNHLPNHLKPCLLYLGVFPEDHEISVTRLVRLLVAEGLVHGEITSEECMEDAGKRYVNDLITSEECKLPKLQKLSCIFFYSRDDILLQQYRFPELNLWIRLTSLKVENGAKGNERRRGKLHLPESLHDTIDHWRVNDEDFVKLKVLKISGTNFHEWDASEDSFPNLQQLWLQSCRSLKAIPLSFGDIPCLSIISIKYCNPSVYDSANEIEKIQAEALNLELKVDLS
ncbi:antimicrobial response protein [Lithospermum erythrorhizon]|uniref:Antimicrobial response protein n=1 Tax=Lithospermum erythrorhizon TaxID=34254 RepID=A0AAV3Q252_LITER